MVRATGTLAPAAIPEETETILRWLESPGVRLVDVEGAWTCPVAGAAPVHDLLEAAWAAEHRSTA